MAKKNFYAVAVGKVPGIYNTWDEAKPQVQGFPNAKYQGFSSREEAEAFMEKPEYKTKDKGFEESLKAAGIVDAVDSPKAAVKASNGDDSKYDAVIFVDGSYNKSTEEYAYGMQITDSEGTHYFKKGFSKDENSKHRNVAGEIEGAKAAIRYSLDHQFKNVKLCYDYKGIRQWCEPSDTEVKWKANTPASRSYNELYEASKERLNIDFCWTPGHTGIEGNEICDVLAKSEIGIDDPKLRTYAKEIAEAKPYVTANERLINATISKGNEVASASKGDYTNDFE